MMREWEVRRLFREHGYEVISIRRRGHWQVRARRDAGPILHFTVPCSPSDRRWQRNLLAKLRRGGYVGLGKERRSCQS